MDDTTSSLARERMLDAYRRADRDRLARLARGNGRLRNPSRRFLSRRV